MVDFHFDLRPLFSSRITVFKPDSPPINQQIGNWKTNADLMPKLGQIINELGRRSAKAQGLRTPITSIERLRQTSGQTIYVLSDNKTSHSGTVLGFLKIGKKDLYLCDVKAKCRFVKDAPAILDFYVHENFQRQGLGKELFDYMLKDQKREAIKFCVDRPSKKMLGFLCKYYKLTNAIQQSNNFVLYKGFFDSDFNEPELPKVAPYRRCSTYNDRPQLCFMPMGRYGARNYLNGSRSTLFH